MTDSRDEMTEAGGGVTDLTSESLLRSRGHDLRSRGHDLPEAGLSLRSPHEAEGSTEDVDIK